MGVIKKRIGKKIEENGRKWSWSQARGRQEALMEKKRSEYEWPQPRTPL